MPADGPGSVSVKWAHHSESTDLIRRGRSLWLPRNCWFGNQCLVSRFQFQTLIKRCILKLISYWMCWMLFFQITIKSPCNIDHHLIVIFCYQCQPRPQHNRVEVLTYSGSILTLKVLNFWKFTSYCSLKPLWSGMGEVVLACTSPTLHPHPLPLCINCRD